MLQLMRQWSNNRLRWNSFRFTAIDLSQMCRGAMMANLLRNA